MLRPSLGGVVSTNPIERKKETDMGRTVLVDADILAFQIASNQEEVYEFNGRHVLHSDLNAGCTEVDNAIGYILEHCDADGVALFLTGPDNFRKGVLPSYKANRVGTRRPMILGGLREYMQENYRTFVEPRLEGDDLIGIHATMPHKGERVVYSADKDLKTVPGLHWCSEDGEVVEITEDEADRAFFGQVLTGDPTDNYKGCPGVGPAAASELLDKKKKWVREFRDMKSGPNKGERRQTWRKVDEEDPWIIILSAYQKAGLTPKDALTQARCARILRHGEYNFANQKVNLWTPN